jgi:hypothetical protein
MNAFREAQRPLYDCGTRVLLAYCGPSEQKWGECKVNLQGGHQNA